MKKVICAKDIEGLVSRGETCLCIDANTLLTPSARDALRAAGLEVKEGEQPVNQAETQAGTSECCPARPGASDRGEISSEMIYEALKTMLGKGLLNGIFDGASPSAPDPGYASESHESGLKLVRGRSVKPEPLDVGGEGARVCYREILGKDEARTSAGFLEIENSQFDWELAYEETDYVIEGTMTVTVDGKTFTAHAGDTFFLPKGAKVVMGSPDRARIFYTTYPAL